MNYSEQTEKIIISSEKNNNFRINEKTEFILKKSLILQNKLKK